MVDPRNAFRVMRHGLLGPLYLVGQRADQRLPLSELRRCLGLPQLPTDTARSVRSTSQSISSSSKVRLWLQNSQNRKAIPSRLGYVGSSQRMIKSQCRTPIDTGSGRKRESMNLPRWRSAKTGVLFALSVLLVTWMDPPKVVGIAILLVIGLVISYFYWVRPYVSD